MEYQTFIQLFNTLGKLALDHDPLVSVFPWYKTTCFTTPSPANPAVCTVPSASANGYNNLLFLPPFFKSMRDLQTMKNESQLLQMHVEMKVDSSNWRRVGLLLKLGREWLIPGTYLALMNPQHVTTYASVSRTFFPTLASQAFAYNLLEFLSLRNCFTNSSP